MNTIHNERVKLLANALNSLALAFIIAGVVAPLVGGQITGFVAARTLAWIGFGVGLHVAAQIVLGRLRP